jgi:hypothetical protein
MGPEFDASGAAERKHEASEPDQLDEVFQSDFAAARDGSKAALGRLFGLYEPEGLSAPIAQAVRQSWHGFLSLQSSTAWSVSSIEPFK